MTVLFFSLIDNLLILMGLDISVVFPSPYYSHQFSLDMGFLYHKYLNDLFSLLCQTTRNNFVRFICMCSTDWLNCSLFLFLKKLSHFQLICFCCFCFLYFWKSTTFKLINSFGQLLHWWWSGCDDCFEITGYACFVTPLSL